MKISQKIATIGTLVLALGLSSCTKHDKATIPGTRGDTEEKSVLLTNGNYDGYKYSIYEVTVPGIKDHQSTRIELRDAVTEKWVKTLYDYGSGTIGDEDEDWVQTPKSLYGTVFFKDKKGNEIEYDSPAGKALGGVVKNQLAEDNDLYQSILAASEIEMKNKL